MERLTGKWMDGSYYAFDPIDIVDNEYSKINYEKLIAKLGEYEQAEEDGLLKMLPCKVGDVLWYLSKNKNKVIPVEVMKIKYECEAENYSVFIMERILIKGKGIEPTILYFSDVGKRVFKTKAEAEQALAKMKGE